MLFYYQGSTYSNVLITSYKLETNLANFRLMYCASTKREENEINKDLSNRKLITYNHPSFIKEKSFVKYTPYKLKNGKVVYWDGN